MYYYSVYAYMVYKIFGYKNIIESVITAQRCSSYLYRKLINTPLQLPDENTKYLDWVLIYKDSNE